MKLRRLEMVTEGGEHKEGEATLEGTQSIASSDHQRRRGDDCTDSAGDNAVIPPDRDPSAAHDDSVDNGDEDDEEVDDNDPSHVEDDSRALSDVADVVQATRCDLVDRGVIAADCGLFPLMVNVIWLSESNAEAKARVKVRLAVWCVQVDLVVDCDGRLLHRECGGITVTHGGCCCLRDSLPSNEWQEIADDYYCKTRDTAAARLSSR
jgi:hypothetical protein